MGLLLDHDFDHVRAVAGTRLTHLVVECSSMGSEFVLGGPIIEYHLNGNAIADDIHIADEVGPCPIQDNPRLTILLL